MEVTVPKQTPQKGGYFNRINSKYWQGVSLSDKLRFCRQIPLPRRGGENYSKVVITKRKDNE